MIEFAVMVIRFSTGPRAIFACVFLAAVLLAAATLFPRLARACDAYCERTVVGYSADSKMAVLRTEWQGAGDPGTLSIELYDLEKEKITETFPVLEDKDEGNPKVRKKRWEKIQADLAARKFTVTGKPLELPATSRTGTGDLPTIHIAELGADLVQPAEPDDPNSEEMSPQTLDAALKTKDRTLVVRTAIYSQMPYATEMGYLVRGYVTPDHERLIAIDRGACVTPKVLVFSMKELKGALAQPPPK